MLRACCLISILWASLAHASPPRFALVIGANRGGNDDAQLRYAQADARHTAEVLREAGGFAQENTVVLLQPTADRVREILAHLNARIRQVAGDNDDTVLWVSYSGHADALALHLGDTRIPWQELRDVAAGSAAAVRLLVVDACRSGEATQFKGTRLDVDSEVSASTTALNAPAITTRLQTVVVAIGGRKAFDIQRCSLSLGMRAGIMGIFEQYDTTLRTAPARWRVAPMLLTTGRIDGQVWGPVFAMAEVGMRASWLRTQEANGQIGDAARV